VHDVDQYFIRSTFLFVDLCHSGVSDYYKLRIQNFVFCYLKKQNMNLKLEIGFFFNSCFCNVKIFFMVLNFIFHNYLCNNR